MHADTGRGEITRRGFLQATGAGALGAATLRSGAPRAEAEGRVPFPVQWVTGADGVKLFVETAGDSANPPILFVHGFCGCRLAWDRQFESALASQFYLVRMDLRGHGDSDKPIGMAAYQSDQTWADDVNAVIRALGLDHPVLVAWSYGGVIVCDYLEHYGQGGIAGINFVGAVTELRTPESLQMIGPDFLALLPALESAEASVFARAIPAFVRLVTYRPLDARDFYAFLGFVGVVPADARMGMAERTLEHRRLLQGLTVPALITQGLADSLVLPRGADFLAGLVPNALRVSYGACGHFPQFEVADRFNTDLADFANRCRRGT